MIISLNANATVNSLLPSVTATTNALNVTERYRHLQTSDVVDTLAAHGFRVVNQKGKLAEHSKHGLFLVNREIGFLDRTGSENFASVALFNSHDGKSALKLVAGFLRMICSNGMVSGTATDHISIRHTQKGFDNMPSLVAQLPDRIKTFHETVNMLNNVFLEPAQIGELARLVHDNVKLIRPIDNASDLLHLRRGEDTATDAYTVANVIQENIIKGGMVSANSNRRLRGITAINKQSELTQLVLNTAVDYVTQRAA